MYKGYITDVEGLKVGHMTDEENGTGCTVIICEEGATGGVDVRGSAPGTREISLFDPKKIVDKVHAVVLSGGSAYGLDAASGVMKYLEEKDLGLDVGVAKVPIVTSAVLFDLGIGNPKVRPSMEMGYEAARLASKEENRQGNIGCGMGATVGKVLGPDLIMKGGLGSASIKVGELVVSAIVGVNALGDIYDYKTGEQLAGPYDRKRKKLLDGYEEFKSLGEKIGFESIEGVDNTTIGLIGTNGKLTKAQANKVAEMAHNGYARSINPVHTMSDGDTIFALSTNKIETDVNLVGSLAAEVMSQAIANAIYSSESFNGVPSYKDI